jgi:putative transposase
MIQDIHTATRAGIRKICATLSLPRSSYYHASSPTPTQLDDIGLGDLITEIFNEHRARYGYRRIYQELADRGTPCAADRVRRLMAERGLKALQPKTFTPTTSDGRADAPSPNLLAGRSLPTRPNEVWAGDITYVRIETGWIYLAVIIDLCTRKVVGWALADHMRSDLVTAALGQATASNPTTTGTVFHSDRGSQYGSKAYRKTLADAGMVQSMSRRANPYDNAWTESFIGTLKNEMPQGCRFEDEPDARSATFEYIEGYYNTRRKHSSISYKTPLQYEREILSLN